MTVDLRLVEASSIGRAQAREELRLLSLLGGLSVPDRIEPEGRHPEFVPFALRKGKHR